jgi:hypothetical protein
MNLRAVVFGFVCICSGHVYAVNKAIDVEQQINEAIEQFEQHHAGNVSAVVSAVASSARWIVVEGALASLVAHNGADSVGSKVVLSGLIGLVACEVLNSAVGFYTLRSIFKQRQGFYGRVASYRAGAQMYNEALEDDMPEDI